MAESFSIPLKNLPLSLPIENALARIYKERNVPALDSKWKRQLAILEEESVLDMLQKFLHLPDYIDFMFRISFSASTIGTSSSSRTSITHSHLGDGTLDSLNLEETTTDTSFCSSSSPGQINSHSSYLQRPSMSFASSSSSLSSHNYTGPSIEVPLSPSIEKALRRIGEEQNVPTLDPHERRKLALLGEEEALKILQRFRSLPDYIAFMIRFSDSISCQGSVSFDAQISGTPLSDSEQGDGGLGSWSMEEEKSYRNFPPSCSIRNLTSASSCKPSISNNSLVTAFGELEFRKAFLLLNYCGKAKVDDVITLDLIRRMKNMQMKEFESEAWRIVGCKNIKEIDRNKNVDWDSGRTYLYCCHIDPDLTCTLKGPYLQKQRTHLQKVLGDENVLDVRFAEQAVEGNGLYSDSNIAYSGYSMIAKEGILVGLRRYQFFVFKDGGKREKKKNPTSSQVKCYFVCKEANSFMYCRRPHTSFNMSMHEARCVFMHVHTVSSVAKYMARFSLILSKTVKLEIDLASVNIERIADTPCVSPDGCATYNEDGEALIHTDGTGFISEDLALKCPHNIYRRVPDGTELDGISSALTHSKSLIREPPLLIQARLFNNGSAVKGTFLVNKKLPPKTIHVRPSMIKVETDPKFLGTQSANSFEIVATSYQPKKRSFLSRYLIALLSYGGVSNDFFLELVETSLEDTCNAYSNKRAALKVSMKHGEMDDFIVPRMILCGIPLDEPYLKDRLSVVLKEERKGLKDGKLPISECYFLMGTADPTGMLKEDEVCVILDHGQISGEVLVYRHPGLHFGDVHVLSAVCVKGMEEIVGNSKYAIFFPTKGPRSLADEIAGGDFDGDMYWVSRNPELLASYNASEPWTQKYSVKSACQNKPTDFSYQQLEEILFQQFLTTRFNSSNNIGSAADSWFAFMDRLLILGDDCAEEKECLREKMLRLVDTYYDALDAPKTGKKVTVPKELKAEKFPHYMERRNCYCSKSVLGLIYDKVESRQTVELQHSKDVWKLPCFEEEVIPPSCLRKWNNLYQQYRGEMTSVLKIDDKDAKEAAADGVIQKYKQILYEAKEFEESNRGKDDIFNEALAIYDIAYGYAKTNGIAKCNFPWRVAGRALCSLYASKQDKDIIVCSKSVLNEVLS